MVNPPDADYWVVVLTHSSFFGPSPETFVFTTNAEADNFANYLEDQVTEITDKVDVIKATRPNWEGVSSPNPQED